VFKTFRKQTNISFPQACYTYTYLLFLDLVTVIPSSRGLIEVGLRQRHLPGGPCKSIKNRNQDRWCLNRDSELTSSRINLYIPQAMKWSLLVGASGAVRGSTTYIGATGMLLVGITSCSFSVRMHSGRLVTIVHSSLDLAPAYLSRYWKGLSPTKQTFQSHINRSFKFFQQIPILLLKRQDSPLAMEICTYHQGTEQVGYRSTLSQPRRQMW
jgi:hypothetical protein